MKVDLHLPSSVTDRLSSTEQVAVGFELAVNDEVADGFMHIFPPANEGARFYSFTSTDSVGEFSADPRVGFASALQDSEPMKWKSLDADTT